MSQLLNLKVIGLACVSLFTHLPLRKSISICRTYMRWWQVYRQSAVFGQTVHDFGGKAASAVDEIEALTDELLLLLGGKGPKTTGKGSSRG